MRAVAAHKAQRTGVADRVTFEAGDATDLTFRSLLILHYSGLLGV